uniref:Reverse transcriptase domain-containing protein n=1 Tax=Tanacetum cinerariifolium TaxID=118510 RepID=A0A6L2LXJ4_TANCI|nr:reverse transcriptase domain-containing protein [Tanacetum cinerariifolium]
MVLRGTTLMLTFTTNLKNDITNFQQKLDETFSEAWDRFKDLLRKYPHHGFSELHKIDTFYNALTQSDQDSLNAAASGNLLNRTPRDALTIIENKSKVRISQNKPIVSKATQQAIVKAIEEICVTCYGPHPYYECFAAGGNTFDARVAVGTYNQGGNRYSPQGDLNYRASNQMGPPRFPPLNVQNSQNYNQNRLTPFETSDYLLEEFTDELALLDLFPPRNEDDNFDLEADLRKIKYLLNKDPSTEFDVEIIDPILEKFTDEPALDYLPLSGDDDDHLFDLKFYNDEWKKLLYVVEAYIVESNDLLPQLLDNESTLPEESFDISSLSSSPFENKDTLFNPGILILGRTQSFNDESKDKDLRDM